MSVAYRAFYLTLAFLMPFALATAAGLPLAKKSMTLKNKQVDISIEYPQTGNPKIDGAIRRYAGDSFKWFAASKPDDDGNTSAYMLQTTYTVERNDGKVLAILFTEYTDMGGAHPNSDYHTLDFLLPDGAQVFLPEIVDGQRGLKRVSDLAAAGLLKSIGTGSDALSDKDTIAMGTGPQADNFKDFVLLPDKLHIFFPPYQVAAYAAGPQEIFIPFSKLKDVMRPDWRAPAASFDCKKAASVIEHAICADAALARLDRQTAEAYQVAIKNAYEPTAQEKVRQEQRAWVARRNAACGSPAPSACLTKFYTDRLAILLKWPT
jgi:peptidoglycan-N-acetylglucosamine deacetylase